MELGLYLKMAQIRPYLHT